MGLPEPLGPYGVSFADFELRRTEELQPSRSRGGGGAAAEPRQKQQQQQQLKTNGIQQNGGQALPQDLEETPATVAAAAPLMRIFYPTEAKTRWSALDAKQRCWVPNYNYMWGFVSRAIPPTSFFVKICISFITCKKLYTLPLRSPPLFPIFLHPSTSGCNQNPALFSCKNHKQTRSFTPTSLPPPCPRLSASTQIWMHQDPALSAVRITNKHLLANIHT
jgi:hypothetical protein